MRNLHIGVAIFAVLFAYCTQALSQSRGYYDAPYARYEADAGTLAGSYTTQGPTYNQADMAFEGSDRTAVNLKSGGSTQWNVSGNFNRLGIVIRYSVAGVVSHTDLKSADVEVYVGGLLKTTLTVNTKYSWEDLKNNGNSNNGGITNTNWRMRFDEVRYRVDQSYPSGTTIKLVSKSNDLWIDYVEVESVPEPKTAAQQGANASFAGGNALQAFIDANAGKTIFVPDGKHNVNSALYMGTSNTKIVGAGMWYTQINFTSTTSNNGGIHWSAASGLDVKDLYVTTDQSSRSNSYKGIWGTTTNATVENVWITHFECGVWMGKYGTEAASASSGVAFRNSRFRNNYADGINFCKGANNNLAEHCSFRNNGDDDMAVWPANNSQCYNNTFRYNTAENCYRAASCALYGGYGNKWQYIIVKDNYEVGIRVNGKFAGACFADGTANEFSNIDVIGCGTPFNTFSTPDPAVDITTAGSCNDIRNINFTCITIKKSKFDALLFRNESGYQIRNISMSGITIDGTNRYGQTQSSSWGDAAGIRFVGNPTISNVTFCGSFTGVQGGNMVSIPNSGWTSATSGCTSCTTLVTSVSVSPTTKTIAVGETFTPAPTVLPTDATNKNVAYSIFSGGSYITLNTSTGLVTGKAVGTAVVRVTTQDGSKTADCTITVTAAGLCAGPNIIVKTTTNPTIDGTIETVWSSTVKQGISTQVIGTAATTTGYSGGWKGLYNSSNLYLLIEMVKPTSVPTLYNTNCATDTWWDGSDAVQVFINSGGIKTFNFIYSGNADGTTPSLATTGSTSTTGITYGIKKTGTGAIAIEVAIPWSTIGMTPTDGETLSMDVVTTLSNGTRLAQFTSYSPNDQAYISTSGYGTVTTKVCSTTAIEETSDNDKSIMAYNNVVKVSGLDNGDVVSVYNILGAKVYTLKATQETEYITSLHEGLYTVFIEGTRIAKKVLIIK